MIDTCPSCGVRVESTDAGWYCRVCCSTWVLIAQTSKNGGRDRVYHTESDCSYLQQVPSSQLARGPSGPNVRRLSTLRDSDHEWTECYYCQGGPARGGGTGEGHYESLLAAAQNNEDG